MIRFEKNKFVSASIDTLNFYNTIKSYEIVLKEMTSWKRVKRIKPIRIKKISSRMNAQKKIKTETALYRVFIVIRIQ